MDLLNVNWKKKKIQKTHLEVNFSMVNFEVIFLQLDKELHGLEMSQLFVHLLLNVPTIYKEISFTVH